MGAENSQDEHFHMESHAALLHQTSATLDPDEAKGEPSRCLDAIVVPTIRPWSIAPAIALASEIGCALVVLCTTAEQAGQARQQCQVVNGDLLVTHVTPSVEDEHLDFLTSEHPENDIEPSCHADIARKRNVGLLLARLSGWRAVMFLDDDIRGMTAAAITEAASLTARFQAAGFCVDPYPDNSVVCHAHRLAGGAQDVFPGGSALVIDVASAVTLFPPIYNEDWLFLFDAAQRRSVAVAGTLSQLEYQPFAHPRRAASEEFGDVIAEGLYRLLHEGGSVTDATHAYWRSTLQRRFALIDHIAERLLLGQPAAPGTECALMSLAAARKRLASITELACVSFVRAWRADVAAWQDKLAHLAAVGDLTTAAKHLDLPALDGGVNQ